jgi:pimeloyl-ACP methyl ester carboxylesterase
MKDRRRFVLVHGAWHGGWCWNHVRPLLEAAGAQVFTPTLTGLGERAHLRAHAPSLEDHVQDVIGVIESEELSDIVLVGHSYAGLVTTVVADRLKSKIRHLVYLDAAVPNDGDDFASHIPNLEPANAERRRAAFRAMASDGVWLPAPPPEFVGVEKADDASWLRRRLTPHPVKTWLEPVVLRNGGHAGLPKTYVLATKPPTTIMGYPVHGEVAKAGKQWSYREIGCGHDMMIIEPAATAQLLLEAGGA